MHKGIKLGVPVLAAFIAVTFLHVWLNIGFEKLGFVSKSDESSFRVGFIPVT
jgi:hypothetical protein